jgi:hypothetical protein
MDEGEQPAKEQSAGWTWRRMAVAAAVTAGLAITGGTAVAAIANDDGDGSENESREYNSHAPHSHPRWAPDDRSDGDGPCDDHGDMQAPGEHSEQPDTGDST